QDAQAVAGGRVCRFTPLHHRPHRTLRALPVCLPVALAGDRLKCHTANSVPAEDYMPYLAEGKSCFRCQHLGASEDGYVCNKGFQNFRGSRGTRTIWTGHLALICPLYEEHEHPRLLETKRR